MTLRRIIVAALLVLVPAAAAMAQDDVRQATAEAAAALMEAPKAEAEVEKPQYWQISSQFDLGFSNTGLWSWAAGGYNTLNLNTGIDAKANYAKDLATWNNRLQLQYGFLWTADKENLLQKSNDVIYLESRFAYKTSKTSKWNYSASFNFRSQFADSYDSYVQDPDTKDWSGTLKSGFASPAYTDVSLGMEWTPNSWFNINLAPLTGGFTICTIEELRKKYGMKLISDDLDPDIGANYRSMLFQLGAQIKVNLKASLNDVLTYETQFVIFTDYLDSPLKQNRVNWDNKIAWQIAKYFKIAVNTWMIYDPIVMIDNRQRIQFKEFLSVNFTYLINNNR